MKNYTAPDPKTWMGRTGAHQEYLHEKVRLMDFVALKGLEFNPTPFALLGYACDEGVKRNQGRVGAAKGPDAIREQLGKLPDHLRDKTSLLDLGNISCGDGDLEACQQTLSSKVSQLLSKRAFPILLGGGHDIAYTHYRGIKDHLKNLGDAKTIGIINFDAHFDLRPTTNGTTSGTPFHQIAQECEREGVPFKYLCLGIRKDANSGSLFTTAAELGALYVENDRFNLFYRDETIQIIKDFYQGVDVLYTTLDLDGFSSAFAPGVSAASPMGFSPDIVLECLQTIIASKKLISMDVAELNPVYDRDGQTAKLAASLIHFMVHGLERTFSENS
tara:strand:+ start:107153 stop:108145 length:993 start_codon:yes stop_codon:yes gene_type:complete